MPDVKEAMSNAADKAKDTAKNFGAAAVKAVTFPPRAIYSGVEDALAKTSIGQSVKSIPFIGQSAFGSSAPSLG